MNLLNCLKISREIAGKKCVQIMKIPGGFDHNVLCLQALTTFFERVSNPSMTHSAILPTIFEAIVKQLRISMAVNGWNYQ